VETAMTIRVAFASDDRERVNQHFGAAEGFIVYDVSIDRASLVALGEFPATVMDGNEDKLATKIEFLAGCAAVFVMAIGASAIKQLLAAGIQPVRVDETDQIEAILADIRAGMRAGGVPWIDKALTAGRSPDRFAQMATEAWTD
jgi:nitrogen fixation protein NifX